MPSLTDDAAHHPATAPGYPPQHGGELSQRILFIIRNTQHASRGSSVQVLRSPVGPGNNRLFLPAPTRHIAYITPAILDGCRPFPQCI